MKNHNNHPNAKTIYREVLSNGITVLIYENFATELVVIDGVVRAGSLSESVKKGGLGNLTAVMLTRGTQQRSYHQIYNDLEAVGADLLFGGGYHTCSFSAQSLVEDVDLLLNMLAQSLRTPTFPEDMLAQVRGQIMTGLQLRADSTEDRAMLSFDKLLYGDHPYGRSAQGTIKTIPTITRDDLTRFHHHHYGPSGMILTVVGGIKVAQILPKLTAVFGDWHTPQQAPIPQVDDVERVDGVRRTAVNLPDKPQADIVLGLAGPRRSAADYLDLSLMNTILGVFGMMGRIGQSVREEQGLAYSAYSRVQSSLGPAPWTASAGVAPENIEPAIQSILHEIERIQNEPVSKEELADSKAYRIGSLPMGLETNGGIADSLTNMELYNLGMNYLQQYPTLIRAITPNRIQQAARKYLSTKHLVISVAGTIN